MFNFFKDWSCFINCLKKIELHIMVWSLLNVRYGGSVTKRWLSILRIESSILQISTNFFSYLIVQNIVAIWFAQNICTFTTKIKRDLLMLHKNIALIVSRDFCNVFCTCSQSDFLSTLNMMKENAQDGEHLRTLTDIEETLSPLFCLNKEAPDQLMSWEPMF